MTLKYMTASVVGVVVGLIYVILVPHALHTANSDFGNVLTPRLMMSLMIGPFWSAAMLAPITLVLAIVRVRFYQFALITAVYEFVAELAWYQKAGLWEQDVSNGDLGVVKTFIAIGVVVQVPLWLIACRVIRSLGTWERGAIFAALVLISSSSLFYGLALYTVRKSQLNNAVLDGSRSIYWPGSAAQLSQAIYDSRNSFVLIEGAIALITIVALLWLFLGRRSTRKRGDCDSPSLA